MRSRLIGPPYVPLYCWFANGITRFSTWSFAASEESRKYPEKVPDGLLVPDFVTAFTTTPIERPCVASNRFETNSTSATESRLKRGCPKPEPATLLVTCCPSILIWNATFDRGPVVWHPELRLL